MILYLIFPTNPLSCPDMLTSTIAMIGAPDIFNFFVEHASYLLVFLFMMIESSFIPFPSEVVVPPAVYLAVENYGGGAQMEPWIVVVVATLGALAGAYINYFLSLWVGRPLVYKFADSNFGHACLLDRDKVVKAEEYFDKHGAVSTFVGRLIPAIRQLISIPAGISRMNLGVFTLYTTLGALVWNMILAALGWWLTTFVKWTNCWPRWSNITAISPGAASLSA